MKLSESLQQSWEEEKRSTVKLTEHNDAISQ